MRTSRSPGTKRLRRKAAVAAIVALALPAVPLAAGEAQRPELTVGRDGITYEAGDWRVDLGGRLHLDAGGGEGRGRELDETSLWRVRPSRARIEFEARHEGGFRAFGQFDAADRERPVTDLALGFSELGPVSLTVGNMEEPFSLEDLTSSNVIPLMERSLANALGIGRNTGIALSAAGERWSAVAGIFGGNINEGVHRGGFGLTGRATWAPLKEDDRVVHLGASAGYRALERRDDLGFDTAPESQVYDVTLVDTGTIEGARSVARVGLEAAYLRGSLLVQGEYMLAHVERRGEPSATLHGGYLLAAYVLTGQKRGYSVEPGIEIGTNYGVFGGVQLDRADTLRGGGSGAWEIALRYSFLDLDSAGLGGGIGHTVTAGVNWYPDENVRLMLNYVRAMGRRLGDDRTSAEADIVQARLQIAF